MKPTTDTTDEEQYQQAKHLVLTYRRASTSFLQRMMELSYNRGAALIERLEAEGVITKADSIGKREILMEYSYKDAEHD